MDSRNLKLESTLEILHARKLRSLEGNQHTHGQTVGHRRARSCLQQLLFALLWDWLWESLSNREDTGLILESVEC